jgi:hypothetical protein
MDYKQYYSTWNPRRFRVLGEKGAYRILVMRYIWFLVGIKINLR